MDEPSSLPVPTPPDLAYWRIPWRFLRDTAMNVAMFFCLAITAFAVDWLVQCLSLWGLTTFVRYLLEGTSYVLAACDAITFITIQAFLVGTTIKLQFRP